MSKKLKALASVNKADFAAWCAENSLDRNSETMAAYRAFLAPEKSNKPRKEYKKTTVEVKIFATNEGGTKLFLTATVENSQAAKNSLLAKALDEAVYCGDFDSVHGKIISENIGTKLREFITEDGKILQGYTHSRSVEHLEI